MVNSIAVGGPTFRVCATPTFACRIWLLLKAFWTDHEDLRRAVEQTRAYEIEYQLAIHEAAQVNSVSQAIQGLSTQAILWSAVKEIADRTSGAQAVSQIALDIMRDTARRLASIRDIGIQHAGCPSKAALVKVTKTRRSSTTTRVERA